MEDRAVIPDDTLHLNCVCHGNYHLVTLAADMLPPANAVTWWLYLDNPAEVIFSGVGDPLSLLYTITLRLYEGKRPTVGSDFADFLAESAS
jgi:hypothetical protein